MIVEVKNEQKTIQQPYRPFPQKKAPLDLSGYSNYVGGNNCLYMGYTYYKGNHVVRVNNQLINATKEIKLNSTTGHLWFEEAISHDTTESIEGVLEHLDKADRYAEFMLGKGENTAGNHVLLHNEQMRQAVRQVLEKIADFRKITLQRWRYLWICRCPI